MKFSELKKQYGVYTKLTNRYDSWILGNGCEPIEIYQIWEQPLSGIYYKNICIYLIGGRSLPDDDEIVNTETLERIHYVVNFLTLDDDELYKLIK